MANLLLWVGLTMIVALSQVWTTESANIAFIGAFVMCIGAAIMIFQYFESRRR